MENSYGIGVENKYSLFLDDESDPFEALANAKKETEKVKASGKENKTGKSAGTKSVKKVAAKEKVPEKAARPADGGPVSGRGGAARGRGGFGAPAESREEHNNRRNYDDRPSYPREGGSAPRFGQEGMEGGERGRGRGRGGFGGRGRGRGRGGAADYRGKREFDRQSGSDRSSGVKAVDKRDGSGRGNWGTVEDEIAASLEPTNLDESATEAEPAVEAPPAEDGEQAPAEPEGPEELTLEEWKRQQEPRNKPQFNERRAGEGESAAQWKNTFELKKKREEDDESEEEDESSDEEEEEHDVRHGRPKRFVEDIQFTFSDSRRGGGRGRGEDGGYRGGFRGRGRGEDGGYRGRGGRGGEEGSRGGYRGRGGRGGEEGSRGGEGGYRGGYRGRGGEEGGYRGGYRSRGGEEGGYRGGYRSRGGEEGGYRGRGGEEGGYRGGYRGRGGEEGGYRGRGGEEGGYRGGYRGRGGEEGGYRGGYRGRGGEEGGYRGRGGEEGGYRGRGGEEGGRGKAPRQQHAPKVDDENDFPSLG